MQALKTKLFFQPFISSEITCSLQKPKPGVSFGNSYFSSIAKNTKFNQTKVNKTKVNKTKFNETKVNKTI